ncbi:MAG TPA: hypothetical protein VG518_03325 [Solirubrobacterales bacterium]|nr:hypothetical protein [Solirubrobacterales bacterium]
MSRRSGPSWGMVGALATALALLLAPSAGAVDIIEAQSGTAQDGWQAGTCQADPLDQCSPEHPELFFTQAAGHPPTGFTQFIVKHEAGVLGTQTPVGNLKTVRVDLPRGLSVNPQATPQCELAEGESPANCATTAPLSVVGVSKLTVAATILGVSAPVEVPPAEVYNLAPRPGEPARFGFSILGNDVFLNAGVAWWDDYHEYFTIDVSKLELPLPGLEGAVRILKNRLVFNGVAGLGGAGGPFLTNPSTCFDPAGQGFEHVYSTFLHADSYEEPAPAFPQGSQEVESPLPPGVMPTGCEQVPFEPGVGSQGGTATTDSPSGPAIEATVPFDPAAAVANSNVRVARVSTPRGMGLNPSAAPGLSACTDAQFGKGTSAPVACPAGSKIGTVSIQTPVLPPDSLSGDVFLGEQLSRDPTSGREYRVFIDAEAPRYGQSVRLVGEVSADPATGQLTTVVSDAPQLPFTAVRVKFDDGKGVLTSPPTCGPNQTSGRMTPWSGTPDATASDTGFLLSSAPGGGPCAKTLAERPFAPLFTAAPESPQAHAFSPLHAHIARSDGQQELKGVDVTLPRGATARLKGIPYCSPQRIALAAKSSAAQERAHPSCPAKSLLGSVTTTAGSGPSPLHIAGKAYLSGPYKGAPLSLAIVTPAAAGPFDLGTVVVRVALSLNPRTAQVHAVSDPIPDVFGGAKLDIRTVAVDLDRKGFALNGTNCRKQASTGVLNGGGADPTNPAAFSSLPVSVAFQAARCRKLGFKPKLHLRLFGDTGQAQHPRLRAVLMPRHRDANVWHAVVGLPHAIFLDQGSLASVCTRPQFEAHACPKKSIYGHAKAFSPLLGKPLKGPVYLRASGKALPDMVAALHGQVDIEVTGRISSAHGGIRTTFGSVPDVPVSKFLLTLPGGRHGLLVASRDLCEKPVVATIGFKGQNGRRAHRRSKLRTPCPQGRRKHRG